MATVLLNIQEYKRASELFHERLDEPFEIANIYHRLGMAYRMLEQYEAAENYFRKALPLLNKFQMREDEAGALSEFGSASKSWVTWSLLSRLDRIEKDTSEANIAKQKALDTFLLFHKEGGENNTLTGSLALSVGSALQQGDAAEAEQVIGQLLEQDGWKEAKKFLNALLAIVVGSVA